MLRQPLVVVMGNVDSGKTATLDSIRKTSVVKSEAGAITQMISSSAITMKTLKNICGTLLDKQNITIPGLVFIDTPGHAAFTNLRKRGGNLADIAILVININEGVKPQTIECIEILKSYKTPFVIALNKIDLAPGWVSNTKLSFLENLNVQNESIKKYVDDQIYIILGKLYELGINSERFDRVSDFTSQVAMIPCSAKTTEGLPELLAMLIGLAQKFLEENLKTEKELPARGTVLEVKEEKGLGITLDVIIYDGELNVNDEIVIGGIDGPIVTKIKGLFEPDEKGKFKPVKKVVAAAGVKLSAPNIKNVVSGMPLKEVKGDLEKIKKEIQEEIDEVFIETDKEGVIVKADSLGSLEAIVGMLKEKKIEIKKASVGHITKKDLADAAASENKLNKIVLGFNVEATDKKEGIHVITQKIIYQIIDDFEKWKESELKKQEAKIVADLPRPAKLRILSGCIFRQSNPAVVGVEILDGTLQPNVELIKEDGSKVGMVKTIQHEKETLQKAEKGKQVAISIPGVVAGRQINEKDILLVDMNEKNFRRLKEHKKYLEPHEIEVLKELAEIKRKENPVWGI
ncbi:MAG: translation initiation factor IF-2 [archaeon]